jgi:hypothetical protein
MQNPSPGALGLVPLNPNVIEVLDSTGTWVPIGSIDPVAHALTPPPPAASFESFGAVGDAVLFPSGDQTCAIQSIGSGSVVLSIPLTMDVANCTFYDTTSGAVFTASGQLGSSALTAVSDTTGLANGDQVGVGLITAAGSPVVQHPLYSFLPADVGKTITIAGASSAALTSTIVSVANGAATLGVNAAVSLNGTGQGSYGTDNAAAIQAALNWSGATNLTVFGGDGAYQCATPLSPVANMKVQCSPACVFVRGFSTSGSGGFLANQNPAVKISNWQWTGGRFKNPTNLGRTLVLHVPPYPGVPANTIWLKQPILNVTGTGLSYTGTYSTPETPPVNVTFIADVTAGSKVMSNVANVAGGPNGNFTDIVPNMQIEGPGITDGLFGHVVSIYGDYITLDRPTIDTYASGIGFALNGNHIELRFPWAINPQQQVGVGGVRITGGDSIRVIGGHIECGDAVFQFAPAPITSTPATSLMDNSITNCWFIGCVGGSYGSGLLLAEQVDRAAVHGVFSMTGRIANCGWIGVTGMPGLGKSCFISNYNSSSPLQGISVIGCTLGGNMDPNVQTINITGAGLASDGTPTRTWVKDITFRDTVVLAPSQNGLNIGQNVANLTFEGGRIEAPTGAGNYAVLLKGLIGGRIRTHLNAGTAVCAFVTADNNGVASCNVDFSGTLFDNLPAGPANYGLQVSNGVGIRAGPGTMFIPAAGVTTANALFVAASPACQNCLIEGADVSAVMAQGSGSYINAAASGVVIRKLVGDRATTAVGSYSQDGGSMSGGPDVVNWTLADSNGNVTPATLFTNVIDNMALTNNRNMTLRTTNAKPGMRVRINRKGSSGGKIRTVLQNDNATTVTTMADGTFAVLEFNQTSGLWDLATAATPCS